MAEIIEQIRERITPAEALAESARLRAYLTPDVYNKLVEYYANDAVFQGHGWLLGKIPLLEWLDMTKDNLNYVSENIQIAQGLFALHEQISFVAANFEFVGWYAEQQPAFADLLGRQESLVWYDNNRPVIETALTQTIPSLSDRISNVDAALREELQTQIGAVVQRHDQDAGQFSVDLDAAEARLDTRIGNLDTTLRSVMDTEITGVRNTHDQDFGTLAGEITGMNKAVSDLSGQIDTARTEIGAQVNRLGDVENSLAEQATNLGTTISNMSKLNASFDAYIQGFQERFGAALKLDPSFLGLFEGLKAQWEAVTANFKTELGAFSSWIDQMENGLENALGTLQNLPAFVRKFIGDNLTNYAKSLDGVIGVATDAQNHLSKVIDDQRISYTRLEAGRVVPKKTSRSGFFLDSLGFELWELLKLGEDPSIFKVDDVIRQLWNIASVFYTGGLGAGKFINNIRNMGVGLWNFSSALKSSSEGFKNTLLSFAAETPAPAKIDIKAIPKVVEPPISPEIVTPPAEVPPEEPPEMPATVSAYFQDARYGWKAEEGSWRVRTDGNPLAPWLHTEGEDRKNYVRWENIPLRKGRYRMYVTFVESDDAGKFDVKIHSFPGDGDPPVFHSERVNTYHDGDRVDRDEVGVVEIPRDGKYVIRLRGRNDWRDSRSSSTELHFKSWELVPTGEMPSPPPPAEKEPAPPPPPPTEPTLPPAPEPEEKLEPTVYGYTGDISSVTAPSVGLPGQPITVQVNKAWVRSNPEGAPVKAFLILKDDVTGKQISFEQFNINARGQTLDATLTGLRLPTEGSIRFRVELDLLDPPGKKGWQFLDTYRKTVGVSMRL